MTTTATVKKPSKEPERSDALDGAAGPDIGPERRIQAQGLAKADFGSARHARIAELAYRKAELRGFAVGHDWQDWFAAEREVDTLIDPNL